MIPPPASYAGLFSDFYERYVEPNLPTPDRMQALNSRLRHHMADEDPVHVVRYVRGQTRGTVYRTNEGWKIFPTDNAPVWWTHALLYSETELPEDRNSLFGTMPHHFFKIARFQTLNQAGYHAAHIVSAKNRDTNWQTWTRAELSCRMLVNIHPCNVFLIAKRGWQRNGGRPDIIAWVTRAYLRRYGAVMERFLADCDPGASSRSGPMNDPGEDADGKASQSSTASSSRSPRRTSPKTEPVGCLRTTRPIVRRDLLHKRVKLEISLQDILYRLPHDNLVEWVGKHTTALRTASWNERGSYSWPHPTRSMAQFLEHYRANEA